MKFGFLRQKGETVFDGLTKEIALWLITLTKNHLASILINSGRISSEGRGLGLILPVQASVAKLLLHRVGGSGGSVADSALRSVRLGPDHGGGI